MRRFIFVLMQVLVVPVMAQNLIENDNYVSNETFPQSYGLPTVRSVGGGTKFIVSYEGDWSNDMKGAFEYACKIWEEVMPTTFPIHVKAILDDKRNTNALSKVSVETKIHDFKTEKYSYYPMTRRSTWLQMKGTKFAEYIGKYDTNTYDYVLTMDMFNEPDVIITYYNIQNKIKDDCSFSIDETTDNNKYDFVTLVLRDLAKSFGLSWRYKNIKLWPSIFDDNIITPYEKYIIMALGYYDAGMNQSTMIDKATQGSLSIKGFLHSWNLYAPKIWNAEKSLSCFMLEPERKLSRLLSSNFGKGSVIRDINDSYTHDVFVDLLNWRGDIAVGIHEGGNFVRESSQTTNNVVGYKGDIVIHPQEYRQKVMDGFQSKYNSSSFKSKDMTNDSISKIIVKYHPNYNGKDAKATYGGNVALLLNDGTWDIVYTFGSNFTNTISTSDFIMHKSNKEYARTTDGYLRCRINETKYSYTTRDLVTTSRYYVLDYIPQVAVMSKSKVLAAENEEDYYRDVEIAYKNIEGTTRIVVSQYNEGEDVPLQYALQDIKSGKFTATVDREYSTTFVITSYNKNGSTTSENYVLPPLTPLNNLKLFFAYNNMLIKVTSDSRRMHNKTLIKSYEIVPVDVKATQNTTRRIKCVLIPRYLNTINISSLTAGIYTLNVIDVFGKTHSFKFVKQ